ncbi:multidrug resistance-associated ABC transporter [Sistotremastrum niveocremeum HHB9708]|uniref:Multidrug resistance-associated ABC transporter n=1 Tax=Sistotremastrum niveocremeum HHB9708 TaxID=1314777 RepID=A0A164YCY7_9AGAM|nr:multidrug resistance-associated ABC transporter [Sistotremastrum niveocremeum HHB9708]
MALCVDHPFDLTSPCIRLAWTTLVPTSFVALILVLFLVLQIKILKPVFSFIAIPFRKLLTIDEVHGKPEKVGPTWRAYALTAVSVVEVLVRIFVAPFTIVSLPGILPWRAILPFIAVIPWIYSALLPLIRPSPTPPYSLFFLLLLQLAASAFDVGSLIYDRSSLDHANPGGVTIAGTTLNLVTILFMLTLILGMPMGVPVESVDKSKIGTELTPEDYATLFQWITFSWVYPLIKRGTNATLKEKDIWALSPTMQSRPVYKKFCAITGSTLLKRLWFAGSLDLILDFTLTLVSVGFNYAGPFFLKRILDALDADVQTPSLMFTAYTYALLAFLSSVLKAQADVLHLWFGRRVSTRFRTELMAAIYDKALKRKDFSGITEKKEGSGKDKKELPSGENSSGADIGKIVQLMSGDANRVSIMTSGLYYLYGAPFEIIIAIAFLYQLLGVSAFSGLLVLLLASPLNHFLAKRAVRIQKGLLAARDKRMAILNEIISAVKFIKFFAWEDKWIARAMEKRGDEIKWMIKARLNGIMFFALWSSVPILVSVISFTTFVLLGHQLTIATAFTSIALFSMLRAPLNVIPTFIVQILQTMVSVSRIDTFLNEPEVDDQVSSLKKPAVSPTSDEHANEASPLGFQHASFKWNTVEEKKDEKDKDKDKAKAKAKDDVKKNGTPSGLPEIAVESEAEGEDREDRPFELQDLDVVFPNGELTVVTGPTASGKTALLMALLGEMTMQPPPPGVESKLLLDKNPHKVLPDGLVQTLSYAAQTPWLQHQSIKDNILFGTPFDQERYDEVIACCALKPDLEVLEDGDRTEIGVRGVSLSGGQKARVALARAVYARTKYVLLDDPLSAVDSHTARILYERVFKGPLLKNRTVILVTHHVELVLPGTYYLVRMLDGRIDLQGKVEDLRKSGVLEHIEQEANLEAKEEKKEEELKEETADNTAAEVTPADGAASENGTDAKPKAKKPRKLVEDEFRETGSVKWSVYRTYLKASSYWVWSILIFLILVVQLLGIGEKLWIAVWGDAYKQFGEEAASATMSFFVSPSHGELEGVSQHPMSTLHLPSALKNVASQDPSRTFSSRLPSPIDHPLFYVGIYAAIGFGAAFINVAASGIQFTGALRASKHLFRDLLSAVMLATVRFHDTTPAGRMLNRFSKDVETIDSSLASSLQNVNSSLATFFISILTVSVVFPAFLLPAFILGYFYVRLAIGYLNTGRDLRRMESTNRSPIFSGFAELLDGIVTVRAFSAENSFLNNLFEKVDLFTDMWYTFWMTNRWLLLYYDFLGAVAVLVTTLLSLSGKVPAGYAGLTITSAMAFTNSIYWTCRFWTSLELDLNSVERIVEYLDLPQQPPRIIELNRPPAYWPSDNNPEGMIVVKDLEIKYAPDLPSVIHGITFALKPRERVGLLGRTGSGKSTLAMSILRFVDPHKGTIMIDGIDITTIGLHDLRARLTFIPQDATLFSGTIRDNLDPFNEYTDAECLDALYRVQMISPTAHASQKTSRAPSIYSASADAEPAEGEGSTSTMTAVSFRSDRTDDDKKAITLDSKVSAGGTNFSQGQRQLIAMARALLRQSSIIVLDEATSSIDFETDAKIQATIRDEFKGSLLLTVAHRLRTVIDYDRLIVLDQGTIAECDTPYNLIRKEDGVFRNMCLKSGTYQELEDAARAQAFATNGA